MLDAAIQSPALSVGEGVFQMCLAAQTGRAPELRFAGAFRDGFYLRGQDTIFAVAHPSVPAGPLHLIVPTQITLAGKDDVFVLEDGRLILGRATIALPAQRRYCPVLPTAEDVRRCAAVLANLPTELPVPEDLASVWAEVDASLEERKLDQVRLRLEGRGIGLTPTGDDVLAGIFLVAYWLGQNRAQLVELARDVQSTRLSQAYLHWAARGLTIAPVFDLIAAALGQTKAPQAYRAAVDRLAAIGGSSGRAMLLGLSLGVTRLI